MRIDIIQLEWVSRKVKQEAADVRANADQMSRVHESVEASWKSQYTMQYLQELERVQGNIYKVSNNLERLAQTIQEIAAETRRVEAQNRQKITFCG